MRIFSFILPVRVSGLIFSEFLISFGCFSLATFAWFQNDTATFLFDDLGFVRLLLVSVSILLGIFVNNLYAQARSTSRVGLVLKLCNVLGMALIVQGLLSYVSSGLGLPRIVMILGSVLAFLALLFWRLFYGTVILKLIGTQNILFVGNDSVLEEIALRIRKHPELGFGILGFVSETSHPPEESPLGPFLGSSADLVEVTNHSRPNRIVVGMLDRRGTLPVASFLRLARTGIVIEEASVAYERLCGRVCSRQLRPSQIIFDNELRSRPGSMALQSVYTNLVALAAIIIMSPFLILAAIAVTVSSRGPLLEPDVRVGQYGIPFALNQFRCHQDGRLTTAGRWLQRSGLFRLPLLFNLLRGEITFVGPRPERPQFAEELSKYFAFYQQRHSVKPGMTGWSQINTDTPDKRTDSLLQLEYDLYYTKHISLALDAYILLHGIRSVLPFAHH